MQDPEKVFKMSGISIIVATIYEAEIFKDFPFLISISGIGKENAYKKAKKLIENGVSLLVSSGMSTALSSEIEIGNIVMPDMIISSDGKKMQVICNKKLREKLKYDHIFSGPVLEIDKVIMNPAEKRSLYKKTGCIAADMESAAIMKAAQEEGVPFICVRAISDSVQMELPQWLIDSIDAYGRLSFKLLIKELVFHFSEIFNFIKLIKGFLKAKNSLRSIMSKIYSSLPL